MEDHHVDRLDVEAWQHVKLTVTNCSIGLNSYYATRTDKSARQSSLIFKAFDDTGLHYKAASDDLVVRAKVKHTIPFRTGP